MNLRRLFLGFSILFLISGLAAACIAPGGWLNKWEPGSYATSGFWGQMTSISEQLGFAKGTAIPPMGLGVAAMGAVGLIFVWSMRNPRD